MGNTRKALRVHAARRGGLPLDHVETECGTIGRTHVEGDEWRTGLGNPFRIGAPTVVTCVACRRWLKVKKQ